jgi:hypothetical protein
MSKVTIHPSYSVLLQDVDSFLAGEITAGEFERRVLDNDVILRTSDGRTIGYDTYQQMFYAVEDYVDDPQLRSEVQGADEHDLESAVRIARESFSRELTPAGVIT